MRQYHDLVECILADGVMKHDRTGTGTLYFRYSRPSE